MGAMKLRIAGLLSLGLAVAAGFVAAGFAVSSLAAGGRDTTPRRVAFQIATGSGNYFAVGEAISGLISHPPGVTRCLGAGRCGPQGLVASARTGAGAIANLEAVNDGQLDSSLSPSDVVGEAVAGKGAFRHTGKETHLRVIAALYPETLHLVAAAPAKIETVSGLRGKRVALGVKDSADFVRARAVLAAYGLSERRIKPVYERPERAATMLEQGKLDAFFVSGGVPLPLVAALTGAHKAVLVPLAGKGRDRLLKNMPGLAADIIPAGLYPGMAAVPAVRGQVLWMVRDTAPPDLVYALTRALFDLGNRPLLDQVGRDGRAIRLDRAQGVLPAPLHAGAARFYREAGKTIPGSAANQTL